MSIVMLCCATNSSVDQGSRYAIDLINSESIIPGYKLDLIEASDDCDISWNGVANLVRNLYYSNKQVIAIVGPECSSVAQVVGSLLGLPQISLNNIHLATSYALSNRTLYPNSFGINTPKFLSVAAFAVLIDHNRWSRIGILYDPSVLEYVDSYRTFLNAMKDYTVEFAFTSYVSLTYFPLAGLKATYVRVIVSFLGRELQEKVLCLAYHMNMTYPRYQWILVDPTTANDPLGNVSIVYTNTEYTCDQDQMASALTLCKKGCYTSPVVVRYANYIAKMIGLTPLTDNKYTFNFFYADIRDITSALWTLEILRTKNSRYQ
eukprot:Em0022g948a